MSMTIATTGRTAMAQALITDLGTGCKMKFYNGTRPAGLGALSGNTLLATVSWASNFGTATSGAVDVDEAGASQTSSGHVSGTPTFIDLTTSADVVKARIDLPTGSLTWTGTIATGQNITLTGLSLTMPHA